MDVVHQTPAPAGAKTAGLHGAVRAADDGYAEYFGTIRGVFGGRQAAEQHRAPSRRGVSATRWFLLRVPDDAAAPLDAPDLADPRPMPDDATSVTATGQPGIFILQSASRFTLWDTRGNEPDGYAHHVQGNVVYTLVGRQVIVDEELLASGIA